jgi:hypothetical protein
LRQIGLIRHTTYVLSVIASASCNSQSLPWGELPSS